ncbi:MAG: DMT family transporter, partial [Clostridia bacterium]|nr:DMT family transporter [Clostridia bacterium]
MKKLRGAVLLVITAIIWGGAFVAQEVGLENIGPFTFTALRFFMGGIALLIITAIVDFFKIKKGIIVREKATYKSKLKYTRIGGVCCGIALCIGSNLQQIEIGR